MKEIGGYFELECSDNPFYHKNGTLFNTARNALRHFVKIIGIKKIFVPSYTCPVVFESIKQENCEILLYEIGDDFMPQMSFPKDSYIIYSNYFGICGKNVDYLSETYPNLIMDNAQAFYSESKGIASFYSPRKFFGLPDGGILLSKIDLPSPVEKSVSFDKCSHLLKRLDLGANAGFADFQKNDYGFSGLPVQSMSALTESLMGNINYEMAKQKRLNNFHYIHEKFIEINKLKIDLQKDDVPMVYPLLLEKEGVREKLIANKIYVAKYWPNVECKFSKYILPLPIDQRYCVKDMEFIVEILREKINGQN